jgi:hypothetical protein
MAITTQRDLATQMIRQLRILDPSVSGDLGTPERKIIDTVAQALADAQLDLSVLTTALDIDSKFGETLDNFLSIFSFYRQKGSGAIGIVEFSRVTESTLDIVIPEGTTVASIANDSGSASALFRTTEDATLPAGDLAVFVPIVSLNVGATNNVAANTITSFGGAIVTGITNITNPTPTTGGLGIEGDAELKVRFKNTLFRNLAGTTDQYLALAVAGAFTNKANVVGPISRYREYIQVPEEDDDTSGAGEGNVDEYTTEASTIPYSDYTYLELPSFVSNGKQGFDAVFFTEGVDFVVNEGVNNQPTVTFLNVYAEDDETVEGVRPGDVVLFEHSYISDQSRNDIDRAITNCVDVFTNGANSTPATTVIPTPTVSSVPFQNNSAHRYHFENYRRIGEPDHRPLIGNIFTPLFWTPLENLPETLVVDNYTYRQGVHYWPVIDVSEIGGTVRARTGVEWSIDAKGEDSGVPTGPKITANTATNIQIEDYGFDKNVTDIQAALEGSKQVTTDVLIHKGTLRYFKLDLTLMYASSSSVDAVNLGIAGNLNSFLSNIYFGSVIQLSDLLQVVHDTAGVDNVRWTYELDTTKPKVIETNAYGVPRLGGVVNRVTTGETGVNEVQSYYLTGSPTAAIYRLKYGSDFSNNIAFDASLATVQGSLGSLASVIDVNSGAGTPANPFSLDFDTDGAKDLLEVVPVSYEIGDTAFNNDFFLNDNELATLPTAAVEDDTVPGLILRRRAQNTWT